MTVEELYKYCVRNGCEDKEIKINVSCSDDWYSKYNIPVNEDDNLFLHEDVVAISVNC